MHQPEAPTAVYHSDWGTNPKKRWLCKAVLEGHRYRAHSPALVGDHFGFLSRVQAEHGETGTKVVGFDFPIGIPSHYAAMMGATEFKAFLFCPSEPLPVEHVLKISRIGGDRTGSRQEILVREIGSRV